MRRRAGEGSPLRSVQAGCDEIVGLGVVIHRRRCRKERVSVEIQSPFSRSSLVPKPLPIKSEHASTTPGKGEGVGRGMYGGPCERGDVSLALGDAVLGSWRGQTAVWGSFLGHSGL
jgi:hypothetical protein